MTEKISPEELLTVTSADNLDRLDTASHCKSGFVGKHVQTVFAWKQLIDSLNRNSLYIGPLSLVTNYQQAFMEQFITDPIKEEARKAVMQGKNPDIFIQQNEEIEKEYAKKIYNFCSQVMTNNKFDEKKILELSTTEDGKNRLKQLIDEFTSLEIKYNSKGLTRLKAMKDLVKSLVIIITGQGIKEGEHPFRNKDKAGNVAPFDKYLDELKNRIEQLYKYDAFEIKKFSEKATGNKIGFSKYEIVNNSKLHTVTLRHYPLPEGIEPNGKILYMPSPLINMPEIYDLAEGKSVVEGMLKEGYEIYLVDYGQPGIDEVDLGLSFYGQIVHEKYFDIIKKNHPGQEIYVMAYCMAGTLCLTYLARRAAERKAQGLEMDIKKIALMATPVKFDDEESGHKKMRDTIRDDYDPDLMNELFGKLNVPSQVIEMGMHEIQPGVQYYVLSGFYSRAPFPDAIMDSAPFLYWLTHGTNFPIKAHTEWISKFFLGNQLYKGEYCLPSKIKELDGKPVDMSILKESGVRIFDYRGLRDPISPAGSCVASEIWGQSKDIGISRGGLNRTIEKNVGHIFVVSKKLLAEFLLFVNAFYNDEELPADL